MRRARLRKRHRMASNADMRPRSTIGDGRRVGTAYHNITTYFAINEGNIIILSAKRPACRSTIMWRVTHPTGNDIIDCSDRGKPPCRPP